MEIESITIPRIQRFWVRIGDLEGNSFRIPLTGIVTKFLNARIHSDSDASLDIWAEVIPSSRRSDISCVLVKTGDETPLDYEFLSVLILGDGRGNDLVYHLYVRADVRS